MQRIAAHSHEGQHELACKKHKYTKQIGEKECRNICPESFACHSLINTSCQSLAEIQMPVITHYISQSDTRSSFSMPASGYMERATGLRMLAVGYFVA